MSSLGKHWKDSPETIARKIAAQRKRQANRTPEQIETQRINSIKNGYKKGHKMLPGSEKGWFKIGIPNNVEENHPHWKGEDADSSIHKWVSLKKGKPMECIDCGITDGRLHWSNVDHKYSRNLQDYIGRCCSCHKKYDNNLRQVQENTKRPNAFVEHKFSR